MFSQNLQNIFQADGKIFLADGGEESGLFCQNSVSNFRAGRLIIATLHWRTFTVLFTFSFLF